MHGDNRPAPIIFSRFHHSNGAVSITRAGQPHTCNPVIIYFNFMARLVSFFFFFCMITNNSSRFLAISAEIRRDFALFLPSEQFIMVPSNLMRRMRAHGDRYFREAHELHTNVGCPATSENRRGPRNNRGFGNGPSGRGPKPRRSFFARTAAPCAKPFSAGTETGMVSASQRSREAPRG